MWCFVITFLIIPLLYFIIKYPHNYWIKKGIKQGNPVFLFGHSLGTFIKTESFAELSQKAYNICSKSRYVGIYQLLQPFLVIRDPELIKQITVKDFDHFINHRSFAPDDADPLWSKNLFALKNQKWRDMRNTLSPAFTGSKMKYMFSLISESGERFAQHFLNQNKDILTVEMKDAFTRFTTDVIANTAFGVKCDSLEERNNEFFTMGKEATDFSGFWQNVKFIGILLFPWLYKIFNITIFSKQVNTFFCSVIKENIAIREKLGIVRPDMIHLLLEARKNGLKYEESLSDSSAGFATAEESEITKISTLKKLPITDIDITAQALLFFFGGFDSVSSLMCFMSYELAVNPDIQERLVKEIDDASEKCNGKLTYEALMGMKYMDMIVSETLRKWPISIATDRFCSKPYTIEPKFPNEKLLHLKKNSIVWFPIFGIHRDPENYPDPERFDPERFNDENKINIKPYTYLPFGVGPRNCIGSRFALLENKALFYHLLSHFQVVPIEKTPIPAKISKGSFNLNVEGGCWLGLKRREK